MKILIFSAFYHPHIGGYEKNVHELAKRLVQRGHQVSVLTCNTEDAEPLELVDDVMVIRVPSWNLLSGTYPVPKPSLELLNTLRAIDTDVVITQTRFFLTSLFGLVMAKRRNIPLVHVERGTCHSYSDSSVVRRLAEMYDHTIGSLIVKQATRVVGVSKSVDKFVEHLGRKDTRVIYNGIENGVTRQKHNSTVIIFVGRLVYSKGVRDLMEAFEATHKLHDNVKLFIVGDGNYREQLEKTRSRLRCKDSVIFYGERSQRQVMDLLSVSDIFVNPSYSEGLPTCVLEAASMGLPIVATDVGGTKEIIRNGVSGIIIKPNDSFQIHLAIEYYLRHPVEAKAMGISAKTMLGHKFGWDRIVSQYEKLLGEVING